MPSHCAVEPPGHKLRRHLGRREPAEQRARDHEQRSGGRKPPARAEPTGDEPAERREERISERAQPGGFVRGRLQECRRDGDPGPFSQQREEWHERVGQAQDELA